MTKQLLKMTSLYALALFVLWGCNSPSSSEGEGKAEDKGVVNVYSHRHYDSDQELFERFEKSTGIKVNVVKANADELMNRMATEGQESPADILLTVDAGRLFRAKDKLIKICC